jgi:prevent-host-death family protein
MRTITAREANQSFSALLRQVTEGEEVVITHRGRPVARMSPVQDASREDERRRIAERLMARLRKGYDLGGVRVDREELYDRWRR